MCQPRICALLVASVILGFAAHPLQSNPHEYGDSPRPSPIPRVHMTEGVSEKHLLKKVEPDYPPEANSRRLEGDVIFRIIIGKNGVVKEIHLRRGNPMLIRAATKALSKWQYETIECDGKPVEVETFPPSDFGWPEHTGNHPR